MVSFGLRVAVTAVRICAGPCYHLLLSFERRSAPFVMTGRATRVSNHARPRSDFAGKGRLHERTEGSGGGRSEASSGPKAPSFERRSRFVTTRDANSVSRTTSPPPRSDAALRGLLGPLTALPYARIRDFCIHVGERSKRSRIPTGVGMEFAIDCRYSLQFQLECANVSRSISGRISASDVLCGDRLSHTSTQSYPLSAVIVCSRSRFRVSTCRPT